MTLAPIIPVPRLKIGIVLSHNFTLAALGNFVDVLRLAADEDDRSRPILCSWRIVAPTMAPIEASAGMEVIPDETLGDPRRFDYIAVIGGLISGTQRLSPEALAFLRAAATARVPLIGICTGIFILHRAGLMQGYKGCVSWFHREDFLEEFGGLIPVTDRTFVVDRDRLTCSGGAAAANLAAFLVDRHLGRAAARKSLSILIVNEDLAREGLQPGEPLDLAPADPLVKRALLWMQQVPDSPPDVKRLARQLGVSRRKLERHFRSDLGLTPAAAGRQMRLARVKNLLERGELSVSAIAADTGFSDVSHLIRTFRAAVGTTPEAWRQSRGRVLDPR